MIPSDFDAIWFALGIKRREWAVMTLPSKGSK